MHRLILCVAAMGVLAPSLHAEVTLNTAARSVEGSAGADCGLRCNPPESDSDFDADATVVFGEWLGVANASASAGGSDGGGGASQFSVVGPGVLTGVADAMADASASGKFASAGGGGSSVMTVTFTVSGASVPYSASGQLAAACTLAGSGLPCDANRARVQLTGPGGTVFSEIIFACDFGCVPPECPCGSNAFKLGGVLAPGDYTLIAEANASAGVDFGGQGIGAGESSFDFTFTYDDGVAPCGAGAGPCEQANGSPGCDDIACCQLICAQDPFCCDTDWDGICANAAQQQCACACEWDLTGDCIVGAADLAQLLADWGAAYGPADLAALLAEWGCSG